MTEEGFAQMLEAVRAQVGRRMVSDGYDSSFEPLRNALIVSGVLNYMCARVPEAQALVGQVKDLIMQLRTAEELTPTLQHFL